MTKTKSMARRLFIYCLGLLILSSGISVSIASNLGVSPVSSVPYVTSVATGIEMGIWTIVIYSICIVLQIVILQKDYKPYNLLQIFSTSIMGVFLTITNRIFAGLSSGGIYPVQLIFSAISIVLIAIGVSLYVSPKLLPLPIEGLSAAISTRFKIPFANAKMIMDSTLVATAVVISFIAFGELNGVREGTIFAAVGVGFCIKFIQKFIGNRLDKFMFGE